MESCWWGPDLDHQDGRALPALPWGPCSTSPAKLSCPHPHGSACPLPPRSHPCSHGSACSLFSPQYVPDDLLPVYREKVVPVADIITPNQFEAE